MKSFVAMLLRMVNRFRAAVLSTDKGGNSPDERKIARGGRKKELPQRARQAAESGRGQFHGWGAGGLFAGETGGGEGGLV